MANSSLFLLEGIDSPHGGFNVIGKVVGCPSAKTGYTFWIQWEMNTLSGNISSQSLRTELPPTNEIKQLLQRAITLFSTQGKKGTTDEDDMGHIMPSFTNVAHSSNNQHYNNTREANPFGTPPPLMRTQYLADLRTVASGFLSLGNTTNSNLSSLQDNGRESIGTRSGEMYDSESDEDVDFELINEQSEENLLLRGFDDDEEIQDEEECDQEDFDSNGASNEDIARNVHFRHSIVDKLGQLIFRYDDVSTKHEEVLDDHLGFFTTERIGLRDDAPQFDDPFQCFEVIGGFSYHVVARLAHGTIRYFHQSIKPTLCRNLGWHKIRWTDVTVEEMYHFLDILLKISLSPVDGGGYKAYFSPRNKFISVGGNMPPLEIQNSCGFLGDIMRLERFQQI